VGRYVLSLVIALAAACMPDLPRDVAIERRFSAAEVALLEHAIAEANRELGDALLGHPVLTYRGRFDDPDGFGFDDFDDDRHGFYVLDITGPEYAWVRDTTERSFGGYATLADLLVRPLTDLDDRSDRFHRIALHEIGHFLGMTHSPDPESLMYVGPHSVAITGFTISDKRSFCLVHDCVSPP
jgi:hypothetical protein